MENDKNSQYSHMKGFVHYLTKYQPPIYSFIFSLVPNFNDADDLMQEVTKVMWEKYGEFQEGTNFQAWGIQIARYIVLEYYREQKKNKNLLFCQDVIEQIDQCRKINAGYSKEHLSHLIFCVQKLTKADRDIVRLRYQKKLKAKEVATYLNKSLRAVYKNLSRIYGLLYECINKQMSLEEI